MRLSKKSSKKALAKALVLFMALAGAVAIGAPAQASTFKSIQLEGYDQGSSTLNSTLRFRIKNFVKKHPELTVLTCIGFDDMKGQGESELGRTRAVAACAQALASNPDLRLAKTIGKFDQTEAGFNNRKVVVVLSTQKDPVMTTYFNHNDGTKTRASYSSSAGNEIVLPTPSREGYQFVGWYAKKGKGALVGMGGEKFVPRKDSTLFALWVSGAASVGGGGSSRSSLGTLVGIYYSSFDKAGYLSSISSWSPGAPWFGPADLTSFLVELEEAGKASVFGCDVTNITTPNDGEVFLYSKQSEYFSGYPYEPPDFESSLGFVTPYDPNQLYLGGDALEGFPESIRPKITGIVASDSRVDFCGMVYLETYYELEYDSDNNPIQNQDGLLRYRYDTLIWLEVWTNSFNVDSDYSFKPGLAIGDDDTLETTFKVQTNKGEFLVKFTR